MARFDVYAGVEGAGPLLDCQANVLSDLNTRFVVPLRRLHVAPRPARRLNPIFQVDGESYVMVTQFATAVPARELGAVVTSLIAQDSVITNAIDMLLCGY